MSSGQQTGLAPGFHITDSIHNSTDTAKLVQFIITPYTREAGSENEKCTGINDTVDILVEPELKLTLTPDIDTLCNNTATGILISSPTEPTNPIRFKYIINPDFPDSLVYNSTEITGLFKGEIIVEGFDNISDRAQRVIISITPYTVDGNGIARCEGIPKTAIIWIEPTPKVTFSAEIDTICTALRTSLTLTTITQSLQEVRFKYNAIYTPVDVEVYYNQDTFDLAPGFMVIDSIVNTSQVPQLVGFIVSPYLIDYLGVEKCPGIIDTSYVSVAPELQIEIDTIRTYIGGRNIRCKGENNGFIKLMPVGGITAYDNYDVFDLGYSWSTAESTKDIYNLAAGSYFVTVNDKLNCIDFDTTNLTEPDTLLTFINIIDSLTCLGADGTINVLNYGGTVDYWTRWTLLPEFYGIPAPYIADTLYNIVNGRYRFETYDTNGCYYNSDTILWEPDVAFINTTVSNYGDYQIRCKGENNGSIEIGNPLEEYLFFRVRRLGPGLDTSFYSDAQLIVFDSLPAGSYMISHTNGEGCTADIYEDLMEPDYVVVEESTVSEYLGGYNIRCFGDSNGSITLDNISGGHGNFSYKWWNNSDTLPFTTPGIYDLVADTYYVRITDPFTCHTFDTFKLTEPTDIQIAVDLPLAPDGMNNLSCYGDTDGYIRLSVSGGDTSLGPYSYNWAHGPTSNELLNIPGGTYYVTISDGINCSDSAGITLTEPPELVINSVNYSDYLGYGVTCYDSTNGFIEIYPEGGVKNYHYVWERDGNDLGRDTSRIYGLESGIYGLTITDYNSCTVNWKDTLKSPLALELTVNTRNIDCSREDFGVARAIVTGGAGQISYLWSNNEITDSIWDLEVGIYGITATDENGCFITGTANIGQDPMIEIQIDVLNEISCYGYSDGRLRANPSAGFAPYSFIWGDEDSTTSSILDNVGMGTYTVTVTDDKDCRGSASIDVTAPEPVSADLIIDSISCYSYSDGAVTINGNNGTGPYTYYWEGNLLEGNVVTGLSANIKYILEIYDSRDCYSDSIEIELSQPYILTVEKDTDNIVKPFCPDHYGGILALKITGGTGPYFYDWEGYESQVDAILEGINQGYYAVEITDANNCIFDTTFYLDAEYETCLDIPNVFTPNEIPDDRNDYWDIRYRGEEGISLHEIYPDAEIKVYNRYGRIVFSCKGSECPDRWDGTYNGRKLPIDSYFYIIKLNNGSGKVYKGTVTILY